jgi:hypothetical protein
VVAKPQVSASDRRRALLRARLHPITRRRVLEAMRQECRAHGFDLPHERVLLWENNAMLDPERFGPYLWTGKGADGRWHASRVFL